MTQPNRSPRRSRLLRVATLVVGSLLALPAQAQIGFEDTGIVPSQSFRGVSNPLVSYRQWTWYGFGLVYAPFYTPGEQQQSGYTSLAAFTNSQTVAFSSGVNPSITADAGTFDFLNASVAGVWRENLQLTVTGYNALNAMVGAQTYAIGRAPQIITPNFTNVSLVTFTVQGGTTRQGAVDPETGQQFAIDNINNVSTVPEPASVALMAVGLAALAVTARRRRS